MHRFFLLDQPLTSGRIVSLAPLAHQLSAVLRLQPPDRILLLDGGGRSFIAEIQSLSRYHGTATLLAEQPCPAEPSIELTLYQCSLKQDKFEWVLQKGTELGIARFVPVISARSVVRPAQVLKRKYERWRAILREAAEQCGRSRLPELADPLDWADAVRSPVGIGFLPWESAHAVPGLGAALQQFSILNSQFSILIGPEGGITPTEAAQAQTHGWHWVSLGPRILRAETASLAATAVVMERCGQWEDG